jgi:hypothetical protein
VSVFALVRYSMQRLGESGGAIVRVSGDQNHLGEGKDISRVSLTRQAYNSSHFKKRSFLYVFASV